MTAVATLDGIPIRPLLRTEYDRLVDAGAFDGERLELLWGYLIAMSPQGSGHSWTIQRLGHLLDRALGDRAMVRVQMPFAADDHAEPEPDLAVVELTDRWRLEHPDRAFLIVEVAATSQRVDRRKLAIYAACGVPEVWLVDLAAAAVEVHTAPAGEAYTAVQTLRSGDSLVPAAFSDVTVPVAAILP